MFKEDETQYCKNCYELQEQLDQLKADRKEALKQLEFVRTLNTVQEAEIRKLTKTLTEIKNKLTVHKTLYYESKLIEKLHKEILQKISECEGNDEIHSK